jgi:hypothetical protein
MIEQGDILVPFDIAECEQCPEANTLVIFDNFDDKIAQLGNLLVTITL